MEPNERSAASEPKGQAELLQGKLRLPGAQAQPLNASPQPLNAQAQAQNTQPQPLQSQAQPQPDPEDARVLKERWGEVQTHLRRSIRKEQFETWFRRCALRRIDERCVAIAVQNSFTRDWVRTNYLANLEDAVRAVLGATRVELEIDPELTLPPAVKDDAPVPPARALVPAPQAPANRLLWASDVALNPHYRFDAFVVGPCNRFAHAAAVGVSEAPGRAYNPFFLHGSVGLGKTHLLQSLCVTLLEREPATRILYLSCETFVNHFISALENGDLTKFRDKYRNVDVLVVDDIHMLANKERTQEEFFNTFNTLYNAGKQIVLSSDSSPKEIPALQDRLVSRFKWGLVTEIEPPCYETRMAILKRKSRDRGRELPEAVAHLLAEHIDSNIRELEGAVTRVIGYASLSGQEVTPELTRKVLRDVFSVQRGQPTMEDVMRVVTTHFGVKATDLQSRKRTNAIAHPRQIGMFLARKITRHSLEEIGGFFGGRDHSTVLYAVEKVEREIKEDERQRVLISGFLDQLHRPT